MKKSILGISVLLFFCFTAHAWAALSSYRYTIDIDIPDPEMISDLESRLGGLEFQVLGGTFGTDWVVQTGNAIPVNGENWIFENYGSWNAVYDDYDYSLKNYTPLISGRILTIISDVELSFADISFYDFNGASVASDYFTSTGFVASAVPVPGSALLLGSGILCLFMTRKKNHETL